MYFFHPLPKNCLIYLQKTCQSALGPNVVSQSNLGDSEKDNHFPPSSRWKGSMKITRKKEHVPSFGCPMF